MTFDLRLDLQEAGQQVFPIHHDYATLPIWSGFDWSSLALCPFDRLYLVVFRSVRRPNADLDLLREHDDRAYEEAVKSGGLLRYFKGDANEQRECLSFCLWEDREAALRASGGKIHVEATGITAEMYESYRLERYELTNQAGSGGDLTFSRL